MAYVLVSVRRLPTGRNSERYPPSSATRRSRAPEETRNGRAAAGPVTEGTSCSVTNFRTMPRERRPGQLPVQRSTELAQLLFER